MPHAVTAIQRWKPIITESQKKTTFENFQAAAAPINVRNLPIARAHALRGGEEEATVPLRAHALRGEEEEAAVPVRRGVSLPVGGVREGRGTAELGLNDGEILVTVGDIA
jgi:hypothetical protein